MIILIEIHVILDYIPTVLHELSEVIREKKKTCYGGLEEEAVTNCSKCNFLLILTTLTAIDGILLH